MIRKRNSVHARQKRHQRIRARLSGTESRPRLAVFRSSRFTYAQVIDDGSGRTIVSASSREPAVNADGGVVGKGAAAAVVGRLVAERALAAGVLKVVFDRGGYLYHGRVQMLADAARGAGLEF
jgi:large subunit ribosomal protein L18